MTSLPQTNAAKCPDSFASWYCLNGATCFSLLIDDSIFYNCWCQTGFHGPRCDYKYTTSRLNDYQDNSKRGKPPPRGDANSSWNSSSSEASDKTSSNGQDGGQGEEIGFIAVPESATSSLIGHTNRGLGNRRHLTNQNHMGLDAQALLVLLYLIGLVLIITIVVLAIRLFKRSTSREAQYQSASQVMNHLQPAARADGRQSDSKRSYDSNVIEPNELQLQQHEQGRPYDVTMAVPASRLKSRESIQMMGLSYDHKAPTGQQQQTVSPAAFQRRANDPSDRHATINSDGLLFGQITYNNQESQHGASDVLEEARQSGLSGSKLEQQQQQRYRYLFVQMAIIKRASDMRRATASLDNNLVAQPGGDLQSFEV